MDIDLKASKIRFGKEEIRPLKNERFKLLTDIAHVIGIGPGDILAVLVDNETLPPTYESGEQIYRVAFWRLLDLIGDYLKCRKEIGIALFDGRSQLHSSIQDRRVVDAYDEYVLRHGTSPLIEYPLFGFSHFYAGLQLADFCAHFLMLEQASQRRKRIVEEQRWQQAKAQVEQEVIRLIRSRVAGLARLP